MFQCRSPAYRPILKSGLAWPRSIDCFVFLLWLFLFVFLASRHTPWRDEFQAWLVATKTDSWGEFFKAIRYERQPPLFYLWLRFLHAILPSSISETSQLQWACWLFSILNSALVIFFLRAPLWLRCGIVFSYGMLFPYGIVARLYASGVFFLLLALVYSQKYSRRGEWYCLGLSAAHHLYLSCLCGALFLMSLYDQRRQLRLSSDWVPILNVTLSILLTLFLLRPPSDSAFPTSLSWERIDPATFVTDLQWGLTGLGPKENTDIANVGQPKPKPEELTPFILVMGLMWWLGFPVVRLLLATLVPILIAIGANYVLHQQIALFFYVMIFLALTRPLRWMALHSIVPLVLCMLFSTGTWLYRWQPWQSPPIFDYSGADELVERMGPELRNANVYAHPFHPCIFSVVGRLADVKIKDIKSGKPFEYPFFTKDSPFYQVMYPSDCARIRREYERNGKTPLLIYCGREMPPSDCGNSELVFETLRPVASDEHFRVARIKW